MLAGLMMDDFQLSLTAIVERAEPLTRGVRWCRFALTARSTARRSVNAPDVPGVWEARPPLGRFGFVAAIPRDATAKFKKTELREHCAQEVEASAPA